MYNMYFVTGATGYLGSAVIKQLTADGARVRALVLHEDGLAGGQPEGVERSFGKVNDKASLAAFLDDANESACVIHCAGIVSIASKNSNRLWQVNVGGTKNLVDACIERNVGKLVYVSSVHAIPERPHGESIAECAAFSPEAVVGDYAKCKAAATAYVLEAAKRGLNASIVHPSGIIGPYDSGNGSVTGTIIAYCRGRLPVGVQGGYDFVDVRDVAAGIVACCKKGRAGECYILSNRYVTVREILETLRRLTRGPRILFYAPLKLVKRFAPLCESMSLRMRKPLFLTPYSVYTMGTNAVFSHDKATLELGYRPRDMERTLADMVKWLASAGRI